MPVAHEIGTDLIVLGAAEDPAERLSSGLPVAAAAGPVVKTIGQRMKLRSPENPRPLLVFAAGTAAIMLLPACLAHGRIQGSTYLAAEELGQPAAASPVRFQTGGSVAPATHRGAVSGNPLSPFVAPVLASLPESTATNMTGEIRGTVLDQTPPAHPVAEQRVRLEIVERGSTATRDTTTDPRGRFSFPRLPLGGIRAFLVQVQYGGIPYTVRAVLTPAVPVRAVQLSVFEPTNDRSTVRGTLAFAVVEPGRGTLRVSVIQRLENATDRAVVVTSEDPLVFPLPLVSPIPRGPQPVEFVGGWHDPQITHGAIADTIPVLPGTMQVAYSVGFAPRSRTATLSWVLPYGATDVEVLVEDRGIRVFDAPLRANGTVTERGRRYTRWSGGPVRPGGTVSARLDGVPVLSEDHWAEIAAGILALVLACGLAAGLCRRSAPAQPEVPP